MNQILSVDPNNKNTKKGNKASLRSILIVFSVILMVFGICLTGTGVYSYFKNRANASKDNGLEVSTNTKPVISIEREDTSNIKIVVTHDKELESVTYTINDGEQKEIETKNKTEVSQSIKLPAGSSHIKINAEDVNGLSSSREDDITVAKEIITLEQVDGRIRVNLDEDIDFDYVEYYWDDNQAEAVKRTMDGDNKDVLIDVLEGRHTLKVNAVDKDGKSYDITRDIKGAKKPELKVKTNGSVFKITASDEEGLGKIEIKLNSNEMTTENLNGKEYSTTVDLEQGVNKLTVTVYNTNGLSTTSKVKYTKETNYEKSIEK